MSWRSENRREMREWVDDERFDGFYGRVDNRNVLDSLVEDCFRERTTEEWLEVLVDHDISCSAINSAEDIVDDPHISARNMLETVEHPEHGEFTRIDTPIKFSTLDTGIRTPPPGLGEDTEDVLTKLGFSEADIEALCDRNVL